MQLVQLIGAQSLPLGETLSSWSQCDLSKCSLLMFPMSLPPAHQPGTVPQLMCPFRRRELQRCVMMPLLLAAHLSLVSAGGHSSLQASSSARQHQISGPCRKLASQQVQTAQPPHHAVRGSSPEVCLCPEMPIYVLEHNTVC